MLFDDLSDSQDHIEKEEKQQPMPQRESKFDALKFEIQDDVPAGTRIKVIGVGGGGCNAASRMYLEGIPGVEFYAINTDRQALNASPIPHKLLIGQKVTSGLGAGADPNIGREAALEDTERIIEIIDGADLVFVAAGMGGGTGTGASPVIASLAKEMNALTVAIITKPFAFEGPRRMKTAEKGVEDLTATVDTVIQIPNEKLISLMPKGTPLTESFKTADDVLKQAVMGMAEIMTTPGLINRDFSDIRAIMLGMGHAMMGTAIAKGENAAVEAARKAIHCPMLNEDEMKGARGILINITGSSKITLDEVNAACTLISKAAENDDVQVNFGLVIDDRMGDEVSVTVIATGFRRLAKDPPQEERSPSRVGYFQAPDTPVWESEPFFSTPSATVDIPESRFEPEPEPELEPEPLAAAYPEPAPEHEHEHVMATAASVSGNVPTNGSHQLDEPTKVVDDLDVPAFLRKERRWFS
jgi:cell division protein FtsZ